MTACMLDCRGLSSPMKDGLRSRMTLIRIHTRHTMKIVCVVSFATMDRADICNAAKYLPTITSSPCE